MRTFVAVACLSGALLCAGCEEDAVKSTDVVELQVCAGEEADLDKGCRDELTADGFSTALVRACLVVTDERRADLKAILTASAGRFSEPKDPEAPRIAELSFGAERCASTQLVAPLTPGHLQVQATVEGYVTAPEKLTVIPAGVDTVDLEPATFELEAKKSSTILVEVHASGLVGSLSQGTRVEVELQPTPSTAAVQVTPSKVVLDEKGEGVFSVFASSSVSSVKVTGTARPPVFPGATPNSASGSITLMRPEEVDGDGGEPGE
jgi:hypothetical protein